MPIIVAINKTDLPTANAMKKARGPPPACGVVLEDFGGTTLASEIFGEEGDRRAGNSSTRSPQAQVPRPEGQPLDRRATGSVVVEAQLDAGKGAVATILVQNGTLRVGDDFICGLFSGRVRALLDERGKTVKSAGPAIPVQVLGLTGVPMAGDQFIAVADAAEARALRSGVSASTARPACRTAKGAVSLEDFMASVGAPTASASSSSSSRPTMRSVGSAGRRVAAAQQRGGAGRGRCGRAVGAVTESDILLAKASRSTIIGFDVRPDTKARAMADGEGSNT